jgi:carbamoyl-phosphate synthase small subunit
MDLAKEVSCRQMYRWSGGLWRLGHGYEEVPGPASEARPSTEPVQSTAAGGVEGLATNEVGEGRSSSIGGGPKGSFVPSEVEGRSTAFEREDNLPHVVAIDYGSKRNIFRNLAEAGARVTVLPATATFEEVMAHAPDGLFLSNGPGDPAATGEYAVPVIRQLLETGKPLFGICLGHQLLGLAVGARTVKMHQGHRGANHPVQRLSDGKVEITSMNHGFAVETESLPDNARPTHISLFDGSLAGLELTDRPAFSVQYHPEASPGPQDSAYLFGKFVGQLEPGR